MGGCWTPLRTERSGSREACGLPLGAQCSSEQCCFRGQVGGAGTTPEHPFLGHPLPSEPFSLMGPCLLRWEVALDDTPSPSHPSPATPILDQ